MKKKILISDSLSQEGVEILKNYADFQVDVKTGMLKEELLGCIDQYDALVVRSATKVTKDVLQKGKNLKVVGRAGVGVDNVDVDEATKLGIIVMNTPEGNTTATAELTIGMILALSRHIPQADKSMKEGVWEKKKYMGNEIFSKILGVIGLGRIGTQVAKKALGLGMVVMGYDKFKSPDLVIKDGIEFAELEDIYRKADYITVHTTMTDETRNMISDKQFNMMKKGVRIINCARGGIINEEALGRALETGKVAGAAFDVFSKEPIDPNHPLLKFPNVILTPHLGASTVEAQLGVSVAVARQIADAIEGKMIVNAVNTPAIDPEIKQRIQPYLTLTEKLGKLQSQLVRHRIKRLTVKTSGEITEAAIPFLRIAAVKGLLENQYEEVVNYINALTKAKEAGIEIIETKSSEIFKYANLITLVIETEKEKTSVSGSLFSNNDLRIVMINEVFVDTVPYGTLILCENDDVPGIIGFVGTLLGNNNINISRMTWGRKGDIGSYAVTVINIDNEIPQKVLDEITKNKHIRSARLIKL